MVHLVTVLTIGGSDPTGGAGIQADLQTIASLRAHGCAVPSALTVQDTNQVRTTSPVAGECVRQQLSCLLADVRVDAAKTSMLGTGSVVAAVAEILSEYPDVPLIVDPVIRSTSGRSLLDEAGVRELRRRLLPQASLVTPNLAEAELLTGNEVRSVEQMRDTARMIAETGAAAVIVKGGHLLGQPVDVLYADGQMTELAGERIAVGREVHGTGCAFSAASAVFTARGHPMHEAVGKAKEYVAAGLRNAVSIGRGALVIDYLKAASEAGR